MQHIVISRNSISVKRPFIKLTLNFHNVRIGIAIGLNGLLAVIERDYRRWLIAIGQWSR